MRGVGQSGIFGGRFAPLALSVTCSSVAMSCRVSRASQRSWVQPRLSLVPFRLAAVAESSGSWPMSLRIRRGATLPA